MLKKTPVKLGQYKRKLGSSVKKTAGATDKGVSHYKGKATYMPQNSDIERKWYLIDAENKILGRVAAKAASLIKGKHKAIFTPHVDCGDFVVITNVAKIRVTGRKLKDKKYLFYSGYPGGLRQVTLENMLKDKPVEVMKQAVRRMLPRRPLYVKALNKLKLFSDGNSPYAQRKDIVKIEVG